MKPEFSKALVIAALWSICFSAQAADAATLVTGAAGFGLALVFLAAWLTTRSRFMTVRSKNIDLAGRLTQSEKAVGQLQKLRSEMNENLNMARAETVAVEQRRREVSNMLTSLRSQVERVSRIDGLTGVANRQQFDISLTDEIKRCVRERKDVSLLLVELDSFVDFLDIHGEEKAEFALQRIASSISDSFRRAGDLVARIGEHKFAVLLPGTDADTAGRFAEKMRKAIYAEALPFPASEIADRITVSVGLAALPPVRVHKPEIVIGMAENALRAAQISGHNCVSMGEKENARNVG